MSDQSIDFDIPRLFAYVADRIETEREALNAADSTDGNHGDHMVEIFRTAAGAVHGTSVDDLPQVLGQASRKLLELEGNASAQVYGRGLACFGEALAQSGISAGELALFVRRMLEEQGSGGSETSGSETSGSQAGIQPAERSQVLKALIYGLSAWKRRESGSPQTDIRMDLGSLFDLGIAYMQARRRNPTKIETITDVAVSSSPLNEVPHRALSGKIAIRAFLEGLAAG